MAVHAIATSGDIPDPNTGQMLGYLAPYKSYVALLNQSGQDPVVSTVFQNTFINVQPWERDMKGVYHLHFDPVPKAKFWMPSGTSWWGSFTTIIPIGNTDGIRGWLQFTAFVTNATMTVDRVDLNVSLGDFSDYADLGDVIADFPFEMRAYE